MKKLILALALLTAIQAQSAQYSNEYLRQIVNEFSSTLPVQMDSVTQITSMIVIGRVLQYTYTINNSGNKISASDAKKLADMINPTNVRMNCTTDFARSLLDDGVGIKHLYRDFDGTYLFQKLVTRKDC